MALRPIARVRDRRRDDFRLLAAHASILSGMRIEARHGETRTLDAEIAFKTFGGGGDGLYDQRAREEARNLFQRNVDRRQEPLPQRRTDKHHDRMRRISVRRGESGEIFRVPRKGRSPRHRARIWRWGWSPLFAPCPLLQVLRRVRSTVRDERGAAVRSGCPATISPDPRIGSTGSASGKRLGPSPTETTASGVSSPSARARAVSMTGSPIRTKEGIRSRFRAANAPSAISGPILAGSPIVSASGRSTRSMPSRGGLRRSTKNVPSGTG